MTKKSTDNEHRPTTGVIQFPGDFPGVFIRGDDALSLAGIIERQQIRIETLSGLNLEKLLRSCTGSRTRKRSAQQATLVK